MKKKRAITTSKTKCRQSCPLTQKLNVGHCGSACRRYQQSGYYKKQLSFYDNDKIEKMYIFDNQGLFLTLVRSRMTKD